VNEFERSGRGPYPGNSLAFGDNAGTLLVTAPRPGSPGDTALTVWDVATGKNLHDIVGPVPERGPPFNEAWNFTVSQDGKWAAAAPLRENGTAVTITAVTIYDTATWHPSQEIALPRGSATGLAFSDDSRLLAKGTIFGDVVVVDTQNGHRTININALEKTLSKTIDAVAFNPDGTQLAAGTGIGITAVQTNTPVRVFMLGDGSPLPAYHDGDQLIRRLVWVRGLNVLAFVCSDHTVRI
jgi:WD40 repeat protein